MADMARNRKLSSDLYFRERSDLKQAPARKLHLDIFGAGEQPLSRRPEIAFVADSTSHRFARTVREMADSETRLLLLPCGFNRLLV
jgi:hypothetical protein